MYFATFVIISEEGILTIFSSLFKKISVCMRRANRYVERKRENPEKKHLTRPQAELGLYHMCSMLGSNPHQR